MKIMANFMGKSRYKHCKNCGINMTGRQSPYISQYCVFCENSVAGKKEFAKRNKREMNRIIDGSFVGMTKRKKLRSSRTGETWGF